MENAASMRVVDVRCYVVPAEWKELVFVLVECDDGSIGVGEGTITNCAAPVASAIGDMAAYLVGKDPGEIERHWSTLYRMFHWRGGAIQMSALAAIDQALWDIAGQAVGLPLYRLLGGACHDRVKVYLNQWFRGARSVADLTEKAQAAVATGIRGLKWYPFRFVPLSRQAYRFSKAEFDGAVGEVAAVRAAVGPEVELMVDLSGVADAHTIVQFCEAIAGCDLLFVEEVAPPENPALLKTLSAKVSARLAAGERRYSRWDFKDLIETQAVGLVQPGVCRAGGITEMRKIAAMAEIYNIGVAPYNPVGPVGTAATVHVSASLPNFVIMETYDDDSPPIRREIMDVTLSIDGDGFALPTSPGLGVRMNETVLRRRASVATSHR
ncbi:mandelate racemase/muconate lactonizing enzyme family protein [Limobrevibacterium gyesilva]|uniref:Mandelate racemase/muconate lactonizing enzyme family protein n=1 Tax=Limobrevibacterium gyesilva TaxID=2991712 RepID=A0AA41YS45_9PROT|nr:mandelate racemase/muconate lactonizing enzyme family protein [Limobrevibacterium gyesilva]MCW3475510.1 mandelate racemase/muconate lactonizing enzyme family protein [Limobrevibacterium gyesilva]